MKKLISVLLILCMLIPTFAMAAPTTVSPYDMGFTDGSGRISSSRGEADEELGGGISQILDTKQGLKLTLKEFTRKSNETVDGRTLLVYYHAASNTTFSIYEKAFAKETIASIKSQFKAAGFTVKSKTVRGNGVALGIADNMISIVFNTPNNSWLAIATYGTSAQKACVDAAINTLIGTKTPTLTGSNLSRSKASTTKSYGLTFSTNSKGTIKFSSSTSKVTVNELGKIKVAANWKGTATITMKLTAYGYYASKTKTLTVTIK